MNNLIKAKLVSSIYISSFGSFFLSTALIQRKINLWKRKKLDHSEYDKFLELSRNYKTNNYGHSDLGEKH